MHTPGGHIAVVGTASILPMAQCVHSHRLSFTECAGSPATDTFIVSDMPGYLNAWRASIILLGLSNVGRVQLSMPSPHIACTSLASTPMQSWPHAATNCCMHAFKLQQLVSASSWGSYSGCTDSCQHAMMATEQHPSPAPFIFWFAPGLHLRPEVNLAPITSFTAPQIVSLAASLTNF
jgi:hypothetical protein